MLNKCFYNNEGCDRENGVIVAAMKATLEENVGQTNAVAIKAQWTNSESFNTMLSKRTCRNCKKKENFILLCILPLV